MRRVLSALVLAATLATAACSDEAPTATLAPAASLEAEAGKPTYAIVGETVKLDGSASTGAVRYAWDFGNGEAWSAPRSEATAEVVYDEPGRYTAVLTAYDEGGARRSDAVLVSVTAPLVHAPRQSSTVAVAGGEVAVVSTDTGELARFRWSDDGTLTLVDRHATPASPRTVADWAGYWAVACQDAARVLLVPREGGEPVVVALPAGSRPYGVVGLGDALFVSLQATGQLARVRLEAGEATVEIHEAIADARGLAVLPDGRVAVTRWRSPDARGEIAVVAPSGEPPVELWTLAFDEQQSSDTENGGVPSYLGPLLVSPTGRDAMVPSLQANIGEGGYRSGSPLTHQTTLRAVLSYLDPASGQELFARRKQFDNRGLAAAGVLSSRGDYLYLAMRGSRAVDRIDVLTGGLAGTLLDVGHAPEGVALSPDDRFLFVDASLSRELVAYDVRDLSAVPQAVSRAAIASHEPLAEVVLRGKQLFNDSFDPRLTRDGYMACSHCHLDGDGDHRVWDFTDRGEGLRNTISLLGRAGAGHGPMHWSANFDEVQDFEHDLRGPSAGAGLMSDESFHTGTRDQPLGDPKAGASADLDALSAYVTSLSTFPQSPFRSPDGGLTEAAARGQALFASEALGCSACHAGPALADSAFVEPGMPRLHDVGTLGPGSGQRLGGALPGLDTPTLHGLWDSAPYLHDGSAATLDEVLTTRNPDDRHGVTSGLSAADRADLVAYLLSLDGS